MQRAGQVGVQRHVPRSPDHVLQKHHRPETALDESRHDGHVLSGWWFAVHHAIGGLPAYWWIGESGNWWIGEFVNWRELRRRRLCPQFTNSPIHQLTNSPIHQFTNSSIHQSKPAILHYAAV